MREPAERELRNTSRTPSFWTQRGDEGVSAGSHRLLTISRHDVVMEIRRGLRIPFYGLGCGGAGATRMERVLAATDGVLRASVKPATATAYVDDDPAETDASELARALERVGYAAGRPAEA